MLTIILTTYLVLSLFVGIIIYAACVVASRSDRAMQTGAEQRTKARKILGVKRVPAKPESILSGNNVIAPPPTKRTANAVYRSSSLN
ncbi:MAG: hypothetical protein NT075_14500 [Chloroflexi bacterium]|nr:hypothetical protein [Chloroflexota bacterium]